MCTACFMDSPELQLRSWRQTAQCQKHPRVKDATASRRKCAPPLLLLSQQVMKVAWGLSIRKPGPVPDKLMSSFPSQSLPVQESYPLEKQKATTKNACV